MNTVQQQVSSAMQNVELTDQAAHQDCPEDYKGALLYKMGGMVNNAKSNAARVFRKEGAYDRCVVHAWSIRV